MRKCLDCLADISSRAVRCDSCKAARKKLTRNAWMSAERDLYRGIKKNVGHNPRKCVTDGCKSIITGHAQRIYCDDCRIANKRATDKSYKLATKNAEKLEVAKAKPKKKRELTEAQIDARAIAIDRENRRIEKELKERAARLPSHLIAARVMRGVCVSVLY